MQFGVTLLYLILSEGERMQSSDPNCQLMDDNRWWVVGASLTSAATPSWSSKQRLPLFWSRGLFYYMKRNPVTPPTRNSPNVTLHPSSDNAFPSFICTSIYTSPAYSLDSLNKCNVFFFHPNDYWYSACHWSYQNYLWTHMELWRKQMCKITQTPFIIKFFKIASFKNSIFILLMYYCWCRRLKNK